MARLLFIVLTLFVIQTSRCKHFREGRLKRHADVGSEGTFSATLRMFTNNIRQLEQDLRTQDYDLQKQIKTLKKLKFELLRKGNMGNFERRMETLDGLLSNVRKMVENSRVTQLGRDLNNLTDRVIVFQQEAKEDKQMFAGYKKKIYDNRSACRVAYTSWASRADANIGGLSQLRVACESKEFVGHFLLQRRNPALSSEVRYRYTCCKFSFLARNT